MSKPGSLITAVCGLLVLACGLTTPAAAQQPQAQPQYAIVITVNRMCCAKESIPAIREMSKIPGVKRVSVDYKSKSLMIEAGTSFPSPRGVWEAAERLKIEPVRLATSQGVYTTKPVQ